MPYYKVTTVQCEARLAGKFDYWFCSVLTPGYIYWFRQPLTGSMDKTLKADTAMMIYSTLVQIVRFGCREYIFSKFTTTDGRRRTPSDGKSSNNGFLVI